MAKGKIEILIALTGGGFFPRDLLIEGCLTFLSAARPFESAPRVGRIASDSAKGPKKIHGPAARQVTLALGRQAHCGEQISQKIGSEMPAQRPKHRQNTGARR
jgi:hypothetical protein